MRLLAGTKGSKNGSVRGRGREGARRPQVQSARDLWWCTLCTGGRTCVAMESSTGASLFGAAPPTGMSWRAAPAPVAEDFQEVLRHPRPAPSAERSGSHWNSLRAQDVVVERVRVAVAARRASDHENPLLRLDYGGHGSGGAASDARRRRRLEWQRHENAPLCSRRERNRSLSHRRLAGLADDVESVQRLGTDSDSKAGHQLGRLWLPFGQVPVSGQAQRREIFRGHMHQLADRVGRRYLRASNNNKAFSPSTMTKMGVSGMTRRHW